MRHSNGRRDLRFGQIVWLCYFPLLFLPDLGMRERTSLGALELSDLLICPYIVLLTLQARRHRRILSGELAPWMVFFVVWALLVTLLMTVRYGYDDSFHLLLSLLKLLKFALYGLAGMLTARALTHNRVRQAFVRSLAFAGVVASLGLFFFGQKSEMTEQTHALGYKASNAVSVMVAILGSYLCGLWMGRMVKTRWSRWLLLASLASMVVGSATSQGRGGWVAGMAGVGYVCWRAGLRKRALLIAATIPVFSLALYTFSPGFQQRVQFTLSQDDGRSSALDDGGRPQNFAKGVEQFQRSPWLGTGFFHRGGETGLYPHGSHNFFLQMFLETGIPGGLVMLALCYRLWRLAGSASAKQAMLEVPSKAALVAALVGGMSGEYFYGGITMFMLLAVYAICGSLPARARPCLGMAGPLPRGLPRRVYWRVLRSQ